MTRTSWKPEYIVVLKDKEDGILEFMYVRRVQNDILKKVLTETVHKKRPL